MVVPPVFYRRTLTGKVRARSTWFGKLLLQVEVQCDRISPWPRPAGQPREIIGTHYEWRDATVDDLLLEIYQVKPDGLMPNIPQPTPERRDNPIPQPKKG